MNSWKHIAAIAAVAAVLAPAASHAAGKGSSLLSLGLGQGSAETYSATDLGFASGAYLQPSQSPETRVSAEYWYLFSDDYAFALSGDYGMSNMKWESSDGTDPEIKATGTSFRVRVGGDRLGKVGDRLTVFMGPGLEFWTGKTKVEVASAEAESENVTRFGVSGRFGGFMSLTDNVSIMGQVGHSFGIASADDSGAKSTWWPSSFNASWGLTFGFGGGQ